MTATKPLTASARYARFILSAWNQREFSELQGALTQFPFMRPENLPPMEHERMDLLYDLGRSLLAWESSGQIESATDQNAALGLVRHLARCE